MPSLRERFEKFLDEKNFFTNILKKIEKKTGVCKYHLATGSVSILGLYLVFGRGASLLCSLTGFVHPAYFSIKATESESKEDDTKWLTYWVVYGIVSILEFFVDSFLYWFPFYYVGKCLFLLWCMATVTWNGSQIIYNRIVCPLFLKRRAQVDSVVNDLSGEALDAAECMMREILQTLCNSKSLVRPDARPKQLAGVSVRNEAGLLLVRSESVVYHDLFLVELLHQNWTFNFCD